MKLLLCQDYSQPTADLTPTEFVLQFQYTSANPTGPTGRTAEENCMTQFDETLNLRIPKRLKDALLEQARHRMMPVSTLVRFELGKAVGLIERETEDDQQAESDG